MFEEYKDIVGIKELRVMLNNIGRDTAYQLVSSGQIKAKRIGNVWYIPKKNIIKYIDY